MIFYIIIILCFLVILFYFFNHENKTRTPPGLKQIPIEKGLPIIGVLNNVEDSLATYFVKLSQKHGPIYGVKFGMRYIVVLNSYEFIKAALVDNGDAFTGRWKLFKHLMGSNDAGIVFIDGHVWSQQRSFVLKTLKEFGMGKSRSNEIVQDECCCFLKDLEKLNNTSVDFSEFIPVYTVNIISKFLMNKRFKHGDRELKIIEKIMATTANKNDLVLNFSLLFPIFDRNEWFVKFIIWISSRKSIFDDCHEFLNEVIKEHKNRLDLNSEGENLVDRFLLKQQQMKDKNGEVDTFTDWQLVRNGLELICAGFDTTSATLVWGFMLMAMYPEIQIKVHNEITDSIGNERLPTMSDKVSLNYTQAVMDEILRFSSVVTLSSLYRSTRNSNVNGYFIPKDTIVIPNIFACNLDSDIWEKPLEFYPENFMSLDNNGVMKYNPRQQLITFGLGKRQCIGESLARMEFFIFFISVLQKFQVRLAKEISRSNFDIFRSNDGVIRTSDIKDFIFKRY